MNKKYTRRTGQGSLQKYETKAGTRWRYQIRVPLDPENPELGSKKISKGGFNDQYEANEALSSAVAKRGRQEKFHGTIPTFAEYGSDWIDSLYLQQSTIQGYRRQLDNYLIPHLGQKPIDKITAPAIGKLYKMLLERGGKDGASLSANTVNKTSITLASILDAAVEEGYLNRNPARLKKIVKAPTGRDIRAEKEEMQTWSREHLQSFLNWTLNVYRDEYHPLWLTLANTGMRRGEAVALQWQDIDFKNKRIAIKRAADPAVKQKTKKPKSGLTRVVDVDDQLLDALKKLRSVRGSISLDLARPNRFIFGNDQGELRNPLQVSKRWTVRVRQAQEAGLDLPTISLHGLRHTHATLLLELEVPPKVVQERLGHSSIVITLDLYSHVTPTLQKSAVERFSALFS